MEFSEVIDKRRSTRKFKNESVPQSCIEDILNTARLAPSVSNIQSTRYVVIKSPEIIAALQNYTTPFVTKAPVVIVCCAYTKAWQSHDERLAELVQKGVFKDNLEDEAFLENYQKSGQIAKAFNEEIAQHYLRKHAAIAMDYMILKAVDLGLGSCWVGLVDRKGVKDLLGLDDAYEVVALLPIGYSNQNPPPRPRLTVSELLLKEL
jgi:nitroreductase